MIVVPGIGTPPVNKWNQYSHRPHWLHGIAANNGTSGTVLVWEHGLSVERGFSVQVLQASAMELLEAVDDVWYGDRRQRGAILFVAHSFGGVIVKQVRDSSIFSQ